MSPPGKRSPRAADPRAQRRKDETDAAKCITPGGAGGLLANWMRMSPFRCCALVLDLRDPKAGHARAAIKSRDALGALRLADAAGARYIVAAGQLHLTKAGAFAVLIQGDDPDMLCVAVTAAFHRLSELGERLSAWIVLTPERERGRVRETLAALSATEGGA